MIKVLVLLCYAMAGASLLAGMSAATIQIYRTPTVVDIKKPAPEDNSYAFAWRSP